VASIGFDVDSFPQPMTCIFAGIAANHLLAAFIDLFAF
jgi:hypothetical protein